MVRGERGRRREREMVLEKERERGRVMGEGKEEKGGRDAVVGERKEW